METALDRFGRVVIPKKIRERKGLDAGSILTIEETEGGIVLKPAAETAPVEMEEGVLIFAGKATDDIESAVRKHREERLRGSA